MIPVETAEQPVFDKEGMMARFFGEEDLAREIIACFLLDLPRQIVALSAALERGDVVEAGRIAHTIKGSSSNVGGERLRALAYTMEKTADKGDLDAVKAQLGAVSAAFDQLKTAMG